MWTIIIRGLYNLNQLFEGQKHLFKGIFFLKFCPHLRLVFKSCFKSKPGYNGAKRYLLQYMVDKFLCSLPLVTNSDGCPRHFQGRLIAQIARFRKLSTGNLLQIVPERIRA